MKVVAFIPIKLNSERLKNKNILELESHPLCWYIAKTLLEVADIDDVYVYCSTSKIMNYMPKGVKFLKRDPYLDDNQIKGDEIYKSFISEVDAETYVLAHATSPFISTETISNALQQVLNGNHDSAFTAKKVQNFVWYKNEPLNYTLDNIPRTQDLESIWIETSAFFIFKKELFLSTNRRIGFTPYCQEVAGIEAIDIDTKEDFFLACAYANISHTVKLNKYKNNNS